MSVLYIWLVIILAILVIALLYIWYNKKWYSKNSRIIKVKPNVIFDFKSALDLTGVPIIVLYQNGKKYNFMVDTGSNVSYIDNTSDIVYTKGKCEEPVLGVGGEHSIVCNVGQVSLQLGNIPITFDVRISDFSSTFNSFKESTGIALQGILGNDILNNQNYCIDFKEYVIYQRV